MATFQQQITASLDDTCCFSTTNYPTQVYARFGYQAVGKGGYSYDAFLRFLLNIPVGSTITSAIITLVAYASRTNDFISQINFTNEDNAADFTNNPFSRTDGGTNAAWDVPDFVADQPVNTPDIKSLIQAFIDRAGYAANNHIAIRIKKGDASTNEYHDFYQYDGSSNYAALLTVEYTPPVAGTNMKINISDVWKDVDSIKINIGGVWKDVSNIKQNIGDVWKDVF